MKKFDAIRLLGRTPSEAARTLGVSPAAIRKWPDELPLRIADRVRGCYARLHYSHLFAAKQPRHRDVSDETRAD